MTFVRGGVPLVPLQRCVDDFLFLWALHCRVLAAFRGHLALPGRVCWVSAETRDIESLSADRWPRGLLRRMLGDPSPMDRVVLGEVYSVS